MPLSKYLKVDRNKAFVLIVLIWLVFDGKDWLVFDVLNMVGAVVVKLAVECNRRLHQ